ncbi:hypothetical protein H0H92_006978 [Tricholoma furcatifolium]|nr:hypothetical protein H0H92_006978 [Tricholoma furcatifolium]
MSNEPQFFRCLLFSPFPGNVRFKKSGEFDRLRQKLLEEVVRGKILLEYKEQESQPPPDANEESASSLVTPSTNSLPIEPVSGPSSVPVNAAPARPESNDSQAPPPISTLEGTSGQVSALEGTLETEQVDPHTNEQRLEHENADVEMTDACRQAETTTTT